MGFRANGLAGVTEAFIVGSVGLAANVTNIASVLKLICFHSGDANVEPVWLCSRNDAIGNKAAVLAASGIFAAA